MRNVRATVWCTCAVEGFHCWPQAPSEVGFLRTRHRHVFHVRAEVRVHHNDRDTEFILLKRAVLQYFADHPIDGTVSCEMIGSALGNFLIGKLGLDLAEVEVSEDRENGARIRWEK